MLGTSYWYTLQYLIYLILEVSMSWQETLKVGIAIALFALVVWALDKRNDRIVCVMNHSIEECY